MLHSSVLLKEVDLVHRCFNTQNDIELVIHLDAYRPHLMLQPCSQPPFVETIAYLVLVVAMQFAPQKGGNVSGFDHLNKGLQEMRINRLQGWLALENDVGSILNLHNAPIVKKSQLLYHRAVRFS